MVRLDGAEAGVQNRINGFVGIRSVALCGYGSDVLAMGVGDDGMSRIFWVLVIACAVIGGGFWLASRAKSQAMNNGAVFMRDQTEAAKASGTAGGGAGHVTQPMQATQSPALPAGSGGQADVSDNAAPTVDSVPQEPPNGMAFAGRGRYQLYRQGDITWRLNTETGQACILFATDSEWRKLKVFEQGCASR